MKLTHSHFDSDLKMLIEMSRDPDMARLNFLRWQIERSRLDHERVSAPIDKPALWSANSDRRTGDLKAA